MECGKKLGFIEGYRHPTKGKENLLCSQCFDSVNENVEKYREFIAPYSDFFDNETTVIEDLQKIGKGITKRIKNIQHSAIKLHFYNTTINDS